jgi:hypothetical protein
MIPSTVIAEKAISKTHTNRFAGEVAGSTSAVVVAGTNLIDVSVSDLNAKDAVRLANGVSNAFVSQISQYQSPATPGGATTTGSTGNTGNTGSGSNLGAVPNGLPVLGIVPRFGTLQVSSSRTSTYGRGHTGEQHG